MLALINPAALPALRIAATTTAPSLERLKQQRVVAEKTPPRFKEEVMMML